MTGNGEGIIRLRPLEPGRCNFSTISIRKPPASSWCARTSYPVGEPAPALRRDSVHRRSPKFSHERHPCAQSMRHLQLPGCKRGRNSGRPVSPTGRHRMNDDIPFDKNLELAPDVVDEPMPGVRRIMANNPGPFTFKGTVSYIIGRGKVAILDPGPTIPPISRALLDAVRNETVTHIFVTHTHRDHSPAVPAIRAATGATVYAEGPHRAARPLHIGETQSARCQCRSGLSARCGAEGWRGDSRRRLVASKQSRRRAIRPITWPMRSRRQIRCSQAITSWPGRRRLSLRRMAP